jgi:hypothetical protein
LPLSPTIAAAVIAIDGILMSIMNPRTALIAVPAIAFLAQPATAQETCVVCTTPAATYRCAIEGSERVAQYRGSTRVMQYLCITELAKLGGHASCSVGRGSGAACMGELKVLRADDALAAAEAVVRDGNPPPGPPQNEPGPPSGSGPPRTLEELARRTVEQSSDQFQNAGKTVKDTAKTAGQQIEKAGDTVGGAVKKTWSCLTSLFTNC